MTDFMGGEVDLTVSDPWDWVTNHGSGPFRCSIISEQDHWRKAVAKVIEPVSIDGEPFAYVLLERRSEDLLLNRAFLGDLVPCNAFFFRSIADLNVCTKPADSDNAVIGGLEPPGWSVAHGGV